MEADPSNSEHGLQEMVVASGISLRLWRLYAQAWLVCLVFPLLALLQLQLSPDDLVCILSGLVVFVTSYTWVMWSHPVRSVAHRPTEFRHALLLLASLTVLVLWLSVAYDRAFLWLFVGVSAVAGVTLSPCGALLRR
jgi:hypothetical protein